MFTITKQRIGNDLRHAVAGEVGDKLITVLATSEVQACEIARCLNESAGIEVEDLTEIADAADLHAAMESIIGRQSYADMRDSAPEVTAEEEAAWREMTPAEQLAETQLRG